MKGWQAVTARLLGRRVSEAPPSFAVQCACGREVSGTRTSSHQILYCAACGTALFVMPRSAYPRPRNVPAEPEIPVPVAPIAFTGRVDESGHNGDIRDETIRVERSPSRTKTANNVTDRQEPGPSQSPRSNPGLARIRRKVFAPVRIVLLGIVAVIGLTIWWSLQIKKRTDAERSLASAVKQAQQALERDDLSEAAKLFRTVRTALDTIGRKDAQARSLRQTAAEIGSLVALSDHSLFDIFREAIDTTSRSGSSMWDDAFLSNYRGAWVLIDAEVTRPTASSPDQLMEVHYPLAVGSQRARIVASLPALVNIIPGGSARRVIFSAQIDEFKHQPYRAEADWCVVLKPGTTVLWSSPENLERSGISVDDETRRVLAEQAQILEQYQ
jgi:hypothetical protein